LCGTNLAVLNPEQKSPDAPHDLGVEVLGKIPGRDRFVSAGLRGPLIRIWDSKTGQLVGRLEDSRKSISEICVSPDGKFLTSMTNGFCVDRETWLWDIDEQELLARVEGIFCGIGGILRDVMDRLAPRHVPYGKTRSSKTFSPLVRKALRQCNCCFGRNEPDTRSLSVTLGDLIWHAPRDISALLHLTDQSFVVGDGSGDVHFVTLRSGGRDELELCL